ncbi:hypothetical protein FSARC_6157 [Fusarium sarcochroum]|uniref:AB hydrolase-1 domain-containing protein n=1 Tax=Fusarium sarcochroum TaxID=1208366 RepID=A0A8H4X9N0_9HYPO|nr:hypothetical protein FSARC_6157 [Fusarium sarcochroum]
MSVPSVVRNRIFIPCRRSFGTDASHQTFHLSDGRTLGFAEFGKPDGKPVLYFHGFPSSRLEAQPVHDMAQRCGIRLVALDRPGFGLSTPKPDYQILDWSTDVMEFARANDIAQFSVLGLSGGGPYALACAYALPKGMLSGVGLFASAPHWAAGAHHMDRYRRVLSVCTRYCPSVVEVGLLVLYRFLKWLVTTGPVTRRIGKWLEKQDESKEPGTVTTKSHSQRVNDLMRILIDEPFRQGASGAVQEARLLSSQDWGFQLEQVKYDNVQIWHGRKDANAPITMIRYMAQRLPHCELYEFENDTHYTMFKHLEPALRSLVEKA